MYIQFFIAVLVVSGNDSKNFSHVPDIIYVYNIYEYWLLKTMGTFYWPAVF